MTNPNPKYGPPKRSASRRSMAEAFVSDPEAAAPTKPFNIRIDKELHRRFKLHATEQDVSMREIIEDLMRDYLDKQEKKSGNKE